MTHRFLFVTWEGGGTVPPQLAVARRLLDRGHEVTVLAEPPTRAEVEAAGCRYAPYREAPCRKTRAPEDDPFQDWDKNPLQMVKIALDTKFCGPAGAMSRDVLATLADHPADVVVVDGYLFGSMVGAEKSGARTVAMFSDLGLRPIPGRPLGGPGLPPATGFLGRLRDRLMQAVAMRLFGRGVPPMNQARAELGLPPLASLVEQFERMDRTILLTSRHFDYPVQPPDDLIYAGVQTGDPVWSGEWDNPFGASDRPLVLVSFGSTFQDQADLYRRAIQAMGRLPVNALVTLGDVLEPDDFDAPKNVHVVRSAPHNAILQHAAAVVAHCGHGTTARSLAAGVPLVCVPLGRDQDDNAARVAWHGAGVRLRKSTPADRLEKAVQRVLGEPSYREAARTMAARMREEAEADVAVRELEALAGAKQEPNGVAA